jgi:hypothetical protein
MQVTIYKKRSAKKVYKLLIIIILRFNSSLFTLLTLLCSGACGKHGTKAVIVLPGVEKNLKSGQKFIDFS